MGPGTTNGAHPVPALTRGCWSGSQSRKAQAQHQPTTPATSSPAQSSLFPMISIAQVLVLVLPYLALHCTHLRLRALSVLLCRFNCAVGFVFVCDYLYDTHARMHARTHEAHRGLTRYPSMEAPCALSELETHLFIHSFPLSLSHLLLA